MIEQKPGLKVHWHVFSGNEIRKNEAMESAQRFLNSTAETSVHVHSFTDAMFPNEWAAIKQEFAKIRSQVSPDLVFSHHRNDRHQDHQIVAELTWNTFRNHLIMEYEIPKYEGDLGTPNFYMSLPTAVSEKKVRYLMEAYRSQKEKHWFRPELFQGLMCLRGIEAGPGVSYAEAFHVSKMVCSF